MEKESQISNKLVKKEENLNSSHAIKCDMCQDSESQEFVQSECCKHLFCKACCQLSVQKIKVCGFCNMKSPKFRPRQDIEKILKAIVKCEKCQNSVKKRQYQKHLEKTCPFVPAICQFCPQKGLIKSKLFAHLSVQHKKEFLNFLVVELPQLKKNSKIVEDILNRKIDFTFKPLAQIYNKKGRLAKRGTYNRYYCGGPAEFQHSGCDSRCGPNNGCCCCDCMELSLQMNNIFLKDVLINYRGNICKVQNGIPYCGVRINYGSEIYCSLIQRCDSCDHLQTHRIERYDRLLK